jgi:hypothetical protein
VRTEHELLDKIEYYIKRRNEEWAMGRAAERPAMSAEHNRMADEYNMRISLLHWALGAKAS